MLNVFNELMVENWFVVFESRGFKVFQVLRSSRNDNVISNDDCSFGNGSEFLQELEIRQIMIFMMIKKDQIEGPGFPDKVLAFFNHTDLDVGFILDSSVFLDPSGDISILLTDFDRVNFSIWTWTFCHQ